MFDHWWKASKIDTNRKSEDERESNTEKHERKGGERYIDWDGETKIYINIEGGINR